MSSSNHYHSPSVSHFGTDSDEDYNNSISVHGESDIDMMADWFDEEQSDKPSPKWPSKFKKAMKIKVRSQSYSNFSF